MPRLSVGPNADPRNIPRASRRAKGTDSLGPRILRTRLAAGFKIVFAQWPKTETPVTPQAKSLPGWVAGAASFGPIRASLIAKGLVYAPEHGALADPPHPDHAQHLGWVADTGKAQQLRELRPGGVLQEALSAKTRSRT